MNLEWQIQIIDELIAEDHDATIADYIQLVNEITKIEHAEKPRGDCFAALASKHGSKNKI